MFGLIFCGIVAIIATFVAICTVCGGIAENSARLLGIGILAMALAICACFAVATIEPCCRAAGVLQ